MSNDFTCTLTFKAMSAMKHCTKFEKLLTKCTPRAQLIFFSKLTQNRFEKHRRT